MGDSVRIAIIGSGPAGLSAAARAAQRGIAHVLLEKTDHLSDTIFKYQKGKHVMATPAQLVLRADLTFEAGSRESVLGNWEEEAKALGITVRLNAEVKSISGTQGDFTLKLASGDTVRAETVVLAIGTQGNPNLLRAPGGDLPHVQYQLDDPEAYIDEHIFVIGAGDAAIENALGLVAEAGQGNRVTLVNRGSEFARAKDANVKALFAAENAGRLAVMRDAAPKAIEPGKILMQTRDGEAMERCDRIIARVGSAPPRNFVEAAGIAFASDDREAYPTLDPRYQSSVPGIYVIGALAGYPLIKHCINQGHDVVEFIAGNTDLKPADEPILVESFSDLPGDLPVDEWLNRIRTSVAIFAEVSPLQMREFMLDSDVRFARAGEVIFEKNAPGSSLFGIVSGEVEVMLPSGGTVPIGAGAIFGEVGLISGRRRGATIRASADSVLVELPRAVALKLLASVPAAKRAVDRIAIERQLLQMFGSGLTLKDIIDLVLSAELYSIRADEEVIQQGGTGTGVYVVRQGSMVVEKQVGGRTVFLSYLPAGSYFGEMSIIDGVPRNATVRATIKSEVIRLDGPTFARLLEAKPEFAAKVRAQNDARRKMSDFVETSTGADAAAVDHFSATAGFLIDNGIGEATDVLLIDEKLCVGCDNCEKACADSHDGISRLDREAGRTYAHLHVPTSCRHCEHPHCMADCPPNAIHRGPNGEVTIDDTCIGCGNCERNCPYGVVRMEYPPPPKPGFLSWLFLGRGPGPGEPDSAWLEKHHDDAPKRAIKCDMCAGIDGGPSCVRACPTGAAIRVAPEHFLSVARLERESG